MSNFSDANLPPIPEKRYFTIGETSLLCGVKPHVLRYWEQEFPQLRPSTRRGNRRYYQHKDVLLVRQIRSLLYEQGFTISGARQQFSIIKKTAVPVPAPEMSVVEPTPTPVKVDKSILADICDELNLIASRLAVSN